MYCKTFFKLDCGFNLDVAQFNFKLGNNSLSYLSEKVDLMRNCRKKEWSPINVTTYNYVTTYQCGS